MGELPEYKIYAVRYAHREGSSNEHFLGGDPHNSPMPLDYYVWAIVGADRTYVVDAGFGQKEATSRGRELLRSPADGLRLIGVEPSTVEDLIITHMHYDHAGTLDDFPNARVHVQDLEMQFATGRHMLHQGIRFAFNVEDVVAMVRRLFREKVVFHQGDKELAPGVALHHVGGHTMGLQVVRVWTQRGWVVLASDASHFYANMQQGRPFPVLYNMAEMFAGWERCRELADTDDHIIPGHDPLVLQRYPAVSGELEGIAARLDLQPTPAPKRKETTLQSKLFQQEQ